MAAGEVSTTKSRQEKQYDYLLKFLLVGDSDVGKQEILSGLEDGAAESPFCSGSGIPFKFVFTYYYYYYYTSCQRYNFLLTSSNVYMLCSVNLNSILLHTNIIKCNDIYRSEI